MSPTKRLKTRSEIATRVHALRVKRGLTQAELCATLGLSQGRYSEIERGKGSFTAEQFLELLRLFNVPVSHFTPDKAPPSAELQNALVRLGARHLNEDATLLPSEHLEQVEDVVRETLLEAGSPRQITALAPVLVYNLDRLNLNKLWATFVAFSLERRLAWLLDSTLAALRAELATGLPRKQALPLKKAEVALDTFLARVGPRLLADPSEPLHDTLGTTILSPKTLAEVEKAASPISHRWGVLTAIQPDDFVQALKASHVPD